MAASVIAPIAIEAPERLPSLGGLLKAANLIPVTDVHYGMGVSYIDEANALPALAPGDCFNDSAVYVPPAATKSFEGITDKRSIPFPIYAGLECGLAYSDDYAERARNILRAGETVTLERAFAGAFFESATEVAADADELTALAELEQWISENYTGLPLLHMSRRVATFLIAQHALFPTADGGLITGQGTPVANGGGYESTAIWVTGQVNIWQGDIVDKQAISPKTNRLAALAERIYSITVDGPIGRVDLT